MKKLLFTLLILFVSVFYGCRKDNLNSNNDRQVQNSLSLEEVKNWFNKTGINNNLETQSTIKSFSLHRLSIDWDQAGNIADKKRNWWVIALPGQPKFQGVQQGYRKLAFLRDSTGTIQARILEVIPDAAYLHLHRGADSKTFTGHIFIYDQQYHLLGGRIFHNGKQVGQIKPIAVSTTNTIPMTGMAQHQLKTDMLAISESCEWQQDTYIDGDGVFTVYAYQICSYSIYDDGFYPGSSGGGDGGGMPTGDPLGGGGGGGGNEGSAPAAAVLPGQTKSAVNPKAYMNCFGSLPDIGSKETITVYVEEPEPGLPFNYGTNSVGHTAISLTKSYNGQTITQTVGFYPGDTKMALTGSPGKIVDNTNLSYSVSISYSVQPFEFNAIANFIANPPSTYNLYTYNCTNFVYDACKAGNITLPDPTGNVGMFQTGMTPGALGSSIRDVAPVTNANTDGGVVGTSHGPCN